MISFWQALLKPFFALAPMDGVTDVIFRHVVCKAAAPDVLFTEFTNAAAFFSEYGRKSTASRLEFTPDEQPIVAQIWGTNPEHYAFMSKELAKRGFAGIDINMGCPVKDVVKTGSGSALIQKPELAAELIAAAKTSGLPVSVKTRIGFKNVNTEEWISFLLKQDLAALTVHGRTQKQMSEVPADWNEIAKAVELRNKIAPQTVIIGNGDIAGRSDGVALAEQSGVDGLMIGRGVFTNPFCFEAEPRTHSREELLGLLNYHLSLLESSPQPVPFAPLKRFFKIYIRDFDGASELRAKLMEARSIAEVRTLIDSIK